MRKLRILPVFMALALVIAGCKAPSVPLPESANRVDLEQEVVLSGTASDGGSRWCFRIATCTVSGEHCAGDGSGRVLTRHSYQTAAMEVFAAEGESDIPSAAINAAEAFNGHFQQILREEVAWFDEMALAADGDYGASGRLPGSVWADASFAYSNQTTLDFWSNGRLVCVSTSHCSETGGEHPNTWRTAETFDLRSGRIVTAADLADDPEQLRDAVEAELLLQAREREAAGGADYYDDYPETLAEWMDRSLLFDETGMTVIFGVYDLADYSAGEQTFPISYADLAPYLNEYGRSVLELPD